jgi:hypothetical protein
VRRPGGRPPPNCEAYFWAARVKPKRSRNSPSACARAASAAVPRAVSSEARFSTQRFRKLSSTSAAIAELSFVLAFFENRQPLEQQSAAMQTEHKKALIMLKTGLNVTRGGFDSEGNFFRFALARI